MRDAHIAVISPIPWFRRRTRPPTAAADLGISVECPTFFYVPGVFKILDGLLLFLSALPAVLALRRRFDFDLIDAHFGFPDGVAALLLGRWTRRPVVVTLRGSELQLARYRLRAIAMGWALKRAHGVIALSPDLAEVAIRLGASRDRVCIIENGVDTERFKPLDRALARAELGLAPNTPLVVSVGHLAAVKGFDRFLEVVASLADEYPSLRYVIVGGVVPASRRYPEKLRAAITRLGLESRVTITGSVPPDRVVLWLSAADLFVLSSEREGSSNALREALACGCPVVTCEAGDAREVVPHHAGLIVEDRRQIGNWKSAVSTALTMSWDRAAIRASAERWTWSHVARRVVEQWSGCLTPSRSPDQPDDIELQSGDAA